MSRRTFRPLQLSTGSPTIENGLRPPGRRVFRQISGGAPPEPPPPVLGSIYRTYAPAVIADYLAISTANWLTGTTGTGTDWLVDYNILYYHFTVTNPQTTSAEYITQPIRWTCDIPTSNGQPWDWWNNGGVPPVRYETHNTAANFGGFGLDNPRTNNAIGLTKGLLPVSGNSHVQVPADGITAGANAANFFIRTPPVLDYAYTIPNLDSIGHPLNTLVASDQAYVGFSAHVYTIRYNVNGVLTALVNGRLPVVAGDQVTFDVWYWLRWLYGAPNQNTRQFAAYIATSKVSNSSQRVAPRLCMFSGYEMGGALFNPASHTYTVTIAGAMTWLLPGGTTGPETMRTHGAFAVSVTSEYVRWYALNPNQGGYAFNEIRLNYAQEIAVITIQWTTAFMAENGVPETCTYTPAATGDYLTSTVPRDEAATVTHCSLGCFDQAGTTTFDLVPWSPSYDGGGFNKYHRGKKSGIVAVVPEVPTTITVTRTTL